VLNYLCNWIRPRQTVTTVRRRPLFRPALEMLEDRWAPAVLTVNSVADNTTVDAALTLREAIQVVDGTLGRALSAVEKTQVTGILGSNDTIQFNLLAGPQTIKLTGAALSITKPVAIVGPGAGTLTVSGNGADRLFYVGSGFTQKLGLVVSISGLTITGGTKAYGAGVFSSATLTVSNTTFSNNTATSNGGGGLYNNGALTLNNCTFTNNTTRPSSSGSTAGGGLLNLSTGTVTITNCTFTGNTAPGTGSSAGSGGAISNSGTMTITNTTLTGNTAASDGGGIYNDGLLTATGTTFTNDVALSDGGAIRAGHYNGESNMTLIGCTFTGNTASSEGGGVDATFSSVVRITNCTFTNNTVGSQGGGLRFDGTTLYLTNDTFTGNRVTFGNGGNFGGGIYNLSPIFVQNTIIAGNFQGTAPGTTPNDVYGDLDPSSSYNLIGKGGSGGLVNGANHNQVGVSNPGLGALASNGGPTQTVALLPGSTAIDRGSNAFVTSGETDQRGLARIVNGTVDIGAFEVQGPTASTFALAGFPSSVQAGVAGTITITARDAAGKTVTGYLGTVHFTSSDPQAALPADYTFVNGDNGIHTFSVTLKTAGSQAITAKDTVLASITGTQSAITVTPASASTFLVAGFPNPTTAGVAGAFSVTARDAFGNKANGYRGTLHFTSSDPQAVLPIDYAFVAADNGAHSFSATFKTAGSQAITVTDTTTGIAGVHAAIGVNPASASALSLAGFPSPTLAGAAGTFTVTAKDTFGNNATGYLGAVHFTSSDGSALLPVDYAFVSGDNGVHTFSATFKTTGTQTLSATDKSVPTITGTHAGITVNPAAFSTLSVTGFPSPTTAGLAGTFTVTALDTLGNIVTGYRGTLIFTSTDGQAALPANYTFVAGDNGVHTFSATLKTAGSQSLSAIDASSAITGTHPAIVVNPASTSTFNLAGFPSPTQVGVAGAFTVTAKDAFGNNTTGYLGSVHFTSSDSQALLPADYTFVNGDSGVHTFSATFQTVGTQTLTATDKTVPSTTGTHLAITVNPAVPTLTVNSSADNTTADNFLTFREAIAVVDGTLGRALTAGEQAQISGTLGTNDAIQFNLPAGPQTITLTGGALSITQAVTINGPGAGMLSINGNNLDRVFVVGQIWSRNLGLVVAINGLTIAGGSQAYGAGLLNFGALTLTNSTFANNTAGSNGGGGVYNVGALTLISCTFTGNTVSSSAAGGGIENISSGTATISNCSFTNNAANGSGSSAGSGGAIANSGAMTITSSTFTSNTAASDGGAIYNDGSLTISTTSFTDNSVLSDGGAIRSGGTLTITACTFAGNSAASVGGALDSSDTTLSVTNATFANNTAVSQGGAIITDAGSGAATLTNCTITANTVTIGSGGLFGGGLFAGRPVTLRNTIVAGNLQDTASGTAADDIAGSVDPASSFNLIGIGGSGGLTAGVNNNQVGVSDPGLGVLANNGGPTLTIALLPGSSAIDQGSNAFVSAGETDARGFARIVNGTVDIGAFELQ
jgi:predicted outer membrane repeat protein